MSNGSSISRWLFGLGLLQVALIGLLAGDRVGDALSLDDLRYGLWAGKVQAGSTLPPLRVVGPDGPTTLRWPGGRPVTVIIAGCASCQADAVLDWSAAARRRGESISILLQGTPDQIETWRKRWRLAGSVFAFRGPQVLSRLGLTPPDLPVQILADGQGRVLSVEGP